MVPSIGLLVLLRSQLGLAGPTGDRLVVAEETSDLSMPVADHFDRSVYFTVVNDVLLVPADIEPQIGVWRLGDFRPHLLGKIKTKCDWSHQADYYLPGNNREIRGPDLTVEECQQICCDESDCLSFDYAKLADPGGSHGAGVCWLSGHVEGASGLAWDSTNIYDYYELESGEEVAALGSISDGSTSMVVAAAKHSGNLYSFLFTDTGSGMPQIVPHGAYTPTGQQSPGHSSPVLTIKIAEWAGSQRLVTGSYDRSVVVWAILAAELVVESRVTDFEWPVWAVQPASSRETGIFVAGGHANITRWAWAGTTNDIAGSVGFSSGPSTENLWTQEQLLVSHSRLVRCLAFDSGLDILASGSEDNRIVLFRRSGSGHDFEFGSRLFDHTDSVTSLSFVLPPQPGATQMLLSGGDDGQVMLFSPDAESTNCAFEVVRNYYLPGNNRYEFQHSSLTECMQICCESWWCASFDFATAEDPGGLHTANTCWMSTLVEGASGLAWDGSGIYHYYEIKKRGTRMLAMQQPGIVQNLAYSPQADLLIIERGGDAVTEGGFLLVKLLEVVCQDGYAPSYDGTRCDPCRLGWAGTGGLCDECPVGTYSPQEGSFACEGCVAGFASSITDMPSSRLLDQLVGLVKCTECPPWSLRTEVGRAFCEWCPGGKLPNEARDECVGFIKGESTALGQTGALGIRVDETWGRDENERSDRFCPRGDNFEECRYPPSRIVAAECPMTCPRPFQVEMDDNWLYRPYPVFCSDHGCSPSYGPITQRCLIQNVALQEQCNEILCMGAMVSMQGRSMRPQCTQEGFNTDCTCAETLRESCTTGLKQLRHAQCSEQCNENWCSEMCHQTAAREHRGIFRSDNVENSFWVRECASRGTQCEATCQNDQRRVSVVRDCGQPDIWDEDDYTYRVWNDALCGGDTDIEEVCTTSRMSAADQDDTWTMYRPDACSAWRAVGRLAPLILLFWLGA